MSAYCFDLQFELDRKSTDAVLELCRRHESGDISDEAYLVGLQTLNNALRGLIDSETIAAIDEEWMEVEQKLKMAAEEAA